MEAEQLIFAIIAFALFKFDVSIVVVESSSFNITTIFSLSSTFTVVSSYTYVSCAESGTCILASISWDFFSSAYLSYSAYI